MDREYKKMREWLPSFFSLQFRQRMIINKYYSRNSRVRFNCLQISQTAIKV